MQLPFDARYFITIDLPLKIPLSKFRFQLIKLPHLLSFLLRK